VPRDDPRRHMVTHSSIVLLAMLSSLHSAPVPPTQHSARPLITRTFKSERVRDQKLEEALRQILSKYPFPLKGEIDYYYNRVDLNRDGKAQVLVYMFGPEVCGTGGCGAYIFEPSQGGYTLLSDFALARNPIIVSEHKTHGWHDLIMFVAGGGIMPGYYAVLTYDGKSYPENPSGDPAKPLSIRRRGTAYLVGSPVIGSGMVLIPPPKK